MHKISKHRLRREIQLIQDELNIFHDRLWTK